MRQWGQPVEVHSAAELVLDSEEVVVVVMVEETDSVVVSEGDSEG